MKMLYHRRNDNNILQTLYPQHEQHQENHHYSDLIPYSKFVPRGPLINRQIPEIVHILLSSLENLHWLTVLLVSEDERSSREVATFQREETNVGNRQRLKKQINKSSFISVTLESSKFLNKIRIS